VEGFSIHNIKTFYMLINKSYGRVFIVSQHSRDYSFGVGDGLGVKLGRGVIEGRTVTVGRGVMVGVGVMEGVGVNVAVGFRMALVV
jgi:hypothetical protein